MTDLHPDRTVGRVAAVHRQTRATLLLTVGFVVVAVVAAVAGLGPGRNGSWLALHLFFVGALLSAISGATPMLAVSWSASQAPTPVQAAVQRTLLLVGVIALAVGHTTRVHWLAAAGGVLVIVALVVLAALLVGIRRSRTVDRFLPTLDAYLVAVILGVVGSVGGTILALGRSADVSDRIESMHALTNLLGLVGIVIAATMPWFVATQARTKTSPRATAARVHAVVAALALTTVTADIAILARQSASAGIALLGYAAIVASLVTLMPRIGRRQFTWAGPRLVQLLAGVAWWSLGVVFLALDAFRGEGPSRRALEVLAVGGYAQILVASLAYLGPVLRSGGHDALARGFRTTRSWISLGVANLAALAALVGAPEVLVIALLAWATDIAVRAARLLVPSSPRPGVEAPQ